MSEPGKPVGLLIDERCLAIWHVCPDPEKFNWLASLHRRSENTFVVNSRIRVYKSRDIFDSDDEFRYEQYAYDGTQKDALRAARQIYRELWQRSGEPSGSWELIRGGMTLKAFHEKLLTMPDIHCDAGGTGWTPGTPLGIR